LSPYFSLFSIQEPASSIQEQASSIQQNVTTSIKTVERLLPIHEAQLLTYLKLTKLNLGYLLNWNMVLMKDGIKRMVNNLKQ